MTIAKAAAPLGAAALLSTTRSYGPVLTGIAVCGSVAALAIAVTARRRGSVGVRETGRY
jgi:hypothetical protein